MRKCVVPLCLNKRGSGSSLRSRVLLIVLILLCGGGVALAQDPFEIHIYEYEPMTWRQYSLETHLNFDPQGTSTAMGTLLPVRNQTHLTLEPTVAFSPEFA